MQLSIETLQGLRITGEGPTPSIYVVAHCLYTVYSFVQLVPLLLQISGGDYVLSERFCRDPLEMFFGKVRS